MKLRKKRRDFLKTAPPPWLAQAEAFPSPMQGAKAGPLAEGDGLAAEVYGAAACDAWQAGVASLAYLWRRFGPPAAGSDPDKELCRYYLSTRDPEVFLEMSPRLSGLRTGVGYLVTVELADRFDRPRRAWWSAYESWCVRHPRPAPPEGGEEEEAAARFAEAEAALGACPRPARPASWRLSKGLLLRVNQALHDALEELLRPVPVRSAAMNVLGLCEVAPGTRLAAVSPLAGLGVDLAALRRKRDGGDTP